MRTSVIVPFYNAEQTIEECAKALLGQTYSEDEYECISSATVGIFGEQIKVQIRLLNTLGLCCFAPGDTPRFSF